MASVYAVIASSFFPSRSALFPAVRSAVIGSLSASSGEGSSPPMAEGRGVDGLRLADAPRQTSTAAETGLDCFFLPPMANCKATAN